MELVHLLNKVNFGATMTHGKGSTSKVDIVETVINRSEMKSVERVLTEFDHDIFYVVEDVRNKQNGIFSKRKNIIERWRTGK